MRNPAAVRAWRPGRSRIPTARLGRAFPVTMVWIGALACAFPLIWTLIASFRPDSSFLASPFVFSPRELTLHNYRAAFDQGNFPTGFMNSVIQVSIVLITTLFFCPLAGYGFAKFEFPGKRFLFGVMMLTLFFVPTTQYVPLLVEMNLIGWVDTYQGLVIPLVISSFGIFWMSGVIAAIPNELLQAARVDGCGSFSAWWRIIMPVISPALVSLGVVTFLAAYNDYFWPLLILPAANMQTIQIVLSTLTTFLFSNVITSTDSWGAVLAASTVVFLPTIIVFLLMQRFFLRGVLQGSIKE